MNSSSAMMEVGSIDLPVVLLKLFELLAWLIFRFADAFVGVPIYLASTLKPKKTCPPIRDETLLLPATVLADNIRKGKMTCESVVRAYIERAKEVNPVVNAIVEDRFDLAVEDAKRADLIITGGAFTYAELKSKFPLLGVPVTVKESIAVAGLSNNAGLKTTRRGKAEKDADVVKAIKEAGAIPIAVTNTPELCLNWESYNYVTGRTLNPYDTRRTPGGSSGGEAALLGSASSVMGMGTDIGGSLRLPAHFCCVWGHKPTPGFVSLEGHYPDCTERDKWERVFTLGPMSRYSTDLPLLLHVMTKDEKKATLAVDEKVDLTKLRVFYAEDGGSWLSHSVDEEIAESIRRIARHFESEHGVKTRKLDTNELKGCFVQHILTLFAIREADDIFYKNPRRSALAELFLYALGKSRHCFFSIMYVLVHRILRLVKVDRMEEELTAIKERFQDALGEDGVLIYPTFPKPAHFHNQVASRACDIYYMSIFNSLGLPVTNCPVGLNRNGLPIGVQVIAKPNRDRLTLAVAREIEKLFGGWVPPGSAGSFGK